MKKHIIRSVLCIILLLSFVNISLFGMDLSDLQENFCEREADYISFHEHDFLLDEKENFLAVDEWLDSSEESEIDIISSNGQGHQGDYDGSGPDFIVHFIKHNVIFFFVVCIACMIILRYITLQVCKLIRYIHNMDGKKNHAFS